MKAATSPEVEGRDSLQSRGADVRWPQPALLEIRDLSVSFGPVQALLGVGLQVRPGEIVALAGEDGAGKTTLFNMLTGLIRSDAGSIVFAGQDITRLAVHRRIRCGLARSFQIIRAEADLARFAPDEEKVAVRLIHACGLVEAAGDFTFSPGAVAAGRRRVAAKGDRVALRPVPTRPPRLRRAPAVAGPAGPGCR